MSYMMAQIPWRSTLTAPLWNHVAYGRGRQGWQTVEDLVALLFETAVLSYGFSVEDSQTHFNLIYLMIVLGLSTEENEVTAEETNMAVFWVDKDASHMEEVD